MAGQYIHWLWRFGFFDRGRGAETSMAQTIQSLKGIVDYHDDIEILCHSRKSPGRKRCGPYNGVGGILPAFSAMPGVLVLPNRFGVQSPGLSPTNPFRLPTAIFSTYSTSQIARQYNKDR